MSRPGRRTGATTARLVACIVAVAGIAACSGGGDAAPAVSSAAGESTATTAAGGSGREAFELALREKLVLPPIPAFSIPTELLSSTENERIAGELDVAPGLYQGIGVVDARCTDAGEATAADSGTAVTGPGAAASFEDATRSITVAGDGTGVYDAPGVHIAVLADGSGVYDDGTTRLSVSADGAGTYSSGDRRYTVRADGSGSYTDDTSRFWRESDGSGGYDDGSVRVSMTAAGEVFDEGEPELVAAAVDVLADGLPRFPPVPAVQTVEPTGTVCGTVIRLDANVLFGFDEAAVAPGGAELLDRVATLLAALGSPRAEVNGHTDQVGDEAYNLGLSQQRADAVVALLVAAGVDGSSLTAQGRGESEPLRAETAPDGADDPAARQLNRRVEIVLVD